ncbi:hypothetical protein E2C01_022741 [Portunus trituberculatus]|uniref:Uncharacterized protein n=1 Tax=Portunus trituberculatus TaxID=210409 RepID=A0A5B7E8Y4_PORTR|nr:hypothetical protein [Portunus trituberculatus]
MPPLHLVITVTATYVYFLSSFSPPLSQWLFYSFLLITTPLSTTPASSLPPITATTTATITTHIESLPPIRHASPSSHPNSCFRATGVRYAGGTCRCLHEGE